jgi:hypothetical protein
MQACLTAILISALATVSAAPPAAKQAPPAKAQSKPAASKAKPAPVKAEPAKPAEPDPTWIELFDGKTLFGWTAEGGSQWRVENGAIVADSGPSGWLRTNVPFSDFRLTIEFQAGLETNSGVFLRSAVEGNPWETGYELQIWDKHPKFPTGSLVNHAAAKGASLARKGWHTFDITARGNRYTVRLDGKVVLQARDFKSHSGHIGLQFNQGQKVAFRSVWLKPLDLACLFNGNDLTGWRKVDRRPVPPQPAEWTVRDGVIHVEKGPGQLETEHTWDDFVLQLDVKANSADPARHPNSGIFFRGDRESFWSGYESQIRNEHKPGDPAAPVDFGTGGIYRQQPARRIVAKDNEWFTKTIVASGRRIAVWVNGVQVSSWEDPRPEGLDVRAGHARLTRGILSLQAHDPTTNLDFRNICISPLKRP